jgi:hypothetical protein
MDDTEDGACSDRQLRLLEGLREAERHGRPAEPRALARAAGYTESSVRTYFSKRLEGVILFRDEQGAWRVRGAIRMSEEEFARKLSQKIGGANDALRTEDGWRSLVRKLLYEGQRRRYRLAREELDLVEALASRPSPEPPPREELPPQPLLFRR